MKRGLSLVFLILVGLSFASAKTCDLNVTLLNQDPYPAVPGDYVKLVFQVEGVQATECGDITFNLIDAYPISLDPYDSSEKLFRKVDYIQDYRSTLQIPFKVRIDDNALDGTNTIEVRVQNKGSSPISKKFDLEVENTKADFDVNIKDFNYKTNEMTLEILNFKNSDTKALTVEIPRQNGIKVKGANKVIVGDLDSNDYTTADFEALPSNGEFKVILSYSDSINVRRSFETLVEFDSEYFTNRKADEVVSNPVANYIWIAVALFAAWMIYRKISKSIAQKKKLAKI